MVLTDHISKEMNELNHIRCQRIPRRPGADWRDLPNERVLFVLNKLFISSLLLCQVFLCSSFRRTGALLCTHVYFIIF